MDWKEFEALVVKADHDQIGDGVDFYSFGSKPLLFLVPHAGGKRVEVSAQGKNITVNVSESGTHILAALAARSVGGKLIVSRVPRTEVDFARAPDQLGGDVKARLGHPDVLEPFHVRTHRDGSKRELLEDYHRCIEKVDPDFLLAYHGMRNTKFDVLLGFGSERQYIGGSDNALRFRSWVRDLMGYSGDQGEKSTETPRVGVSINVLTGESEYNLNRHTGGSRDGVLVEFDKSGRCGSPTEGYRRVSVAIAKAAERWVR